VICPDRATDLSPLPRARLAAPNFGEFGGKLRLIFSKDATADGAKLLRNVANETDPLNAVPWLTFFAAWALLPLAPHARACSTRPQAHDARARAHKPADRPLHFCDC